MRDHGAERARSDDDPGRQKPVGVAIAQGGEPTPTERVDEVVVRVGVDEIDEVKVEGNQEPQDGSRVFPSARRCTGENNLYRGKSMARSLHR